MDCREVEGRIVDLLGGEMSREERQGVLDHLDVCSSCTRAFARARATADLLASLPTVSAPPELRAEVFRRFDPRRDARRHPVVRILRKGWLPTAAAALAAGLLLVVGFRLVLGPRPTPVRLVVLEESRFFEDDDVAFKRMLEGSWSVDGEDDPVSLYAELAKE